MKNSSKAQRVNIGDTRLHIVERDHAYPLILLHGGPGLDHHMFGDYIDTQPVLILAGRYDRTCVVEGAEAMAKGLPGAEFVIFENSRHMTYVEENEKYLTVVPNFLNKNRE